MDLRKLFGEHKAGNRKSKKLKDENRDKKSDLSESKNKKNIEKSKDIKDELKEPCECCQGTGETEGYRCSQCCGRGYIKKRRKLNLKSKKDTKQESNLIGKKKAKKIQTMFFNGLTIEEISAKLNIDEYLVKQIIQDLKDKLEQSLNRNN